MADVQTASSVPSPKKKSAGKPKAKNAPSHPKTSDMVNAAITNLKERGGSSLQAIKKYIAATYKVDVEKLAPFIRKYLKSGVSSGALMQTKGKGASGSFKLSGSKTEKKASAGKKKSAVKKPKKAESKPAKKSKAAAGKSPKKQSGKPKKADSSKPKKAKAPKKEKAKKSPKKPKSPKPKKATGKKAPAKK